MKKKRNEEEAVHNIQQVVIPEGCRKPRTRSHCPRPRTDFSPFVHSSHSLASSSDGPCRFHRPQQGSNFDFPSYKRCCFSASTARVDQNCDSSFLSLQEETPKLPLMRLCMCPEGDCRCSSNCRQMACTNAESIARCATLAISYSWKNKRHRTDHVNNFSPAEALSCTPNEAESPVAEDGNLLVPGCLVWARSLNRAYLPANDLCTKQHLNPCKQLDRSPGSLMILNHDDLLSEKSSPSTSNRVDDDCLDAGRGKRIRKPKLHFDEAVVVPVKPKKNGRRLRIMRQLGLIAPSGSPFTSASHSRTNY